MSESKSKRWFEENVAENRDELIEIGELANRILHDNLSLGLNDPMTTIAIYASIFETICDSVAEREDEWSDFCLNVADRIKIGYTTTDNENDEKSGNFMVFIQHVESTTSDEPLDEEEDDTIVIACQWNAANIKIQSDIIKEIAAKAKKNLENLINIKIESSDFVIPMFCMIHRQIINYIRLKRVDNNQNEYEINMAGLYNIGVQETADGEEDIYFVPSISLKLKFKNDAVATGGNE